MDFLLAITMEGTVRKVRKFWKFWKVKNKKVAKYLDNYFSILLIL